MPLCYQTRQPPLSFPEGASITPVRAEVQGAHRTLQPFYGRRVLSFWVTMCMVRTHFMDTGHLSGIWQGYDRNIQKMDWQVICFFGGLMVELNSITLREKEAGE